MPGSKSEAIRALVVAALAEGRSTVHGAPRSDDVRAVLESLRRLGVAIEGEAGDGPLRVEGTGGRFPAGDVELDLGGSATGLRFLACLAALRKGTTVLDGDPSLRARPAGPLGEALEPLGVTVATRRGRPPVTVSRGPGRGPGEPVMVTVDGTSQVLSGLLLAGAGLAGGLRIGSRGTPVSVPYLDLTVGVLVAAGAKVTRRSGLLSVAGPPRGGEFHVEADWSSAAYPLVGAALMGRAVTVPGLRPRSLQADRAVLRLLRSAGVPATVSGEGARCDGSAGRGLRPFEFDLRGCPDLAPAAAVLALFAPGESRLAGAAHLRHKESDRIASCVAAVRALGGAARPLRDGFTVRGGSPRPGRVDSRGDHRIALAFHVAAAAIPGAEVRGMACVSKSWPGAVAALAPLLDAR